MPSGSGLASPVMEHLRFVQERSKRIAVLLLAVTGTLQAQSTKGNWNSVEAIPSGTKIAVVVAEHKFAFKCSYDYVSDFEISCTPRGFAAQPLVLSRQRVREIRVEHTRRDIAVGVIIGAGLGVGIGAGTGGSGSATRPATAIVCGVAFGALGGYIGRYFSPARGTVVYRR